MSTDDRAMGWKQVWVVCYRANNGRWYPVDQVLFATKWSADWHRKANFPAGGDAGTGIGGSSALWP